jgi:hypothetical protein
MERRQFTREFKLEAVRRRKICTGHVSGGRIKSERSRKGLANHIAISTATGVVNIFRLSNRWRTIDEIEAEAGGTGA